MFSFPNRLIPKLIVTPIGSLHGRALLAVPVSPIPRWCLGKQFTTQTSIYSVNTDLTCCHCGVYGTCLLSPSATPGVSPSRERGPLDQVLSSTSAGCVGFDDPRTTINTYSPSFSCSHVPGATDGSSSSRGRSVRVQSSTRPPIFRTDVGGALPALACSPSLPGAGAICSVSRAPATSLMNTSSCSSRENASNLARFFRNSCGVIPYNAVGPVVPRLVLEPIIIIILVNTRLLRKSMIAHLAP